MFDIFTRKTDMEFTSLKTYPELRYVYDNIKRNIFEVRKFAIDLKYRPETTSILEKLLINYCPNTGLDDFYFFEIVSEHAVDSWCRALGFTYSGSIGKAFRNDLHKNGDEFYVIKDTDIKLTTMDKNEKLKWLLEFEPLRVLYTTSDEVTYEFRQKNLDLGGSFIVMEFDPVMFFMGYKYWVSIMGEDDAKDPYLYISKFVLPGMIRSRTQWQLLNVVLKNTYRAGSKDKVKLDLPIQNHKFDFRLLSIDREINKAVSTYLNFIYNRKLQAEVYLNTMPFIPFKENETVLDFLKIKDRNLIQTRWVKWLTRLPVILSLYDLFGESGKGYNRSLYTGFRYDMKAYEHNGVPLPRDSEGSTKNFMDTNFNNAVEIVYGENYNPKG